MYNVPLEIIKSWCVCLEENEFFLKNCLLVYLFMGDTVDLVGYSFMGDTVDLVGYSFILFSQPLRSGRIWHKVNF